MPRIRLNKALPLVLAMTALATLGSGGAAAATQTDDPCMTVAPDATVWLGQGIPTVKAHSGPDYLHGVGRPCLYFVADIQVPFNSSGGPGFTGAFSIDASAPFSGGCELRRQWTYVYRKSSSRSSFQYLGHLGLYGDGNAHCTWTAVPYHDDPWPSSFTPPNGGVATYRVLTMAWYELYPFDDEVLAPMVRASHLRVL